VKWKPLISAYIGVIPLSDDMCIEHDVCNASPSEMLVTTAINAKVGAAASGSHSVARNPNSLVMIRLFRQVDL
jgi:hypothetical protein